MPESLLLPVAAIVVATVAAWALYDPQSSLALSSGFGILRSIALGLSGLMLVLSGVGWYWLAGVLLWALAIYFGRGHADRFAQATDIRGRLNG